MTAEGEPKPLDFGIAKLLNPELSPSTIDPTRFQFRLMTPEYASPEQVRGEAITTASDVYSLGVLLYELLTGHRPYRLKSNRMEEITRVICEEEPIRPSTVIEQVEEVAGPGGTTRKITAETVSKTREGSKEKLRGRLKGDLDNIILMAMRKEPLRRYASVEQLSEDIQRVLEGFPVKAHKYDEAEPLLRSALEVRKVAFGEQHLDVSESVNNLAELHYQKGDYEAAEPLFREALVMRRKLFGKEHPDVAESANNLAALHFQKGDYEAAEPLFREALVMDRKLLGDEHPAVARSLNDLANLLKDKGDCEAAEPFHKEACNIFQKALGLNHWRLSHARSDYSACLIKLGRYEQAEGLLLSAYPVLQTELGERHERTQKAVSRLVELYEAWGKPEKAAEYQSPSASQP